MKNQFIFDVELIIDYKRDDSRDKPYIATHRVIRCLTKKELISLINENEPKSSLHKDYRVTLNIRGTTY